MDFKDTIIKWYRHNQRVLPWRNTTDPYRIWLSEIVLQQTRVEQGRAYYERLIYRFPDVFLLANAYEDQVLKLWQGLGYYTRARNMHAAAKLIVNEYAGVFPATYTDILKLPGVGEYTASAIASFAYGLPHPVVDGNVMRVLSRFFQLEAHINSTEGKRHLVKVANELLDRENPGEYNQAIMEFGALQCIPKNPGCNRCPLASSCQAFKSDKVDELPVKKKGKEQRKRYFHYLVINGVNNGKAIVMIRKRSEKGIWKNLFDFPLIESENFQSAQELKKSIAWKTIFADKTEKLIDISRPFTHQLSHQLIFARFHLIDISGSLKQINDYELIERENIKLYPVPRLIDQFLNEYVHWLKFGTKKTEENV